MVGGLVEKGVMGPLRLGLVGWLRWAFLDLGGFALRAISTVAVADKV